MSFGKYIKDKIINILIAVLLLAAVVGILLIFRLNPVALCLVAGLMVIAFVASFLYDYFRKKGFYDSLAKNVERMDKAYLVLETLQEPAFYEGKLIYDTLYDIDKSMADNVGIYKKQSKEFAEYIEMWIHEVKLPLSAISLKLHNLVKLRNEYTDEYKKLLAETRRIEEYVNQVLYFVRSENAEKDYHISSVAVSDIIHDAAMTYRDTVRDNGIEFVIGKDEAGIENPENVFVNTDRKWLLFIMGQFISNSIKYRKSGEDSFIRVYADKKDGSRDVLLCVEDNGLGIPTADQTRIFEKSFTGSNGKLRTGSTGMGLYIVKELCEKLGHEINVDSREGEFTRLSVTLQNCNIK
jgi:signal transduction histidine kinase